jgi:transposase-like protein
MESVSAATRWARIVEQCSASGLSAREFADQHDLNRHTLMWWRWKLGQGARQDRRGIDFVDLMVQEPERRLNPDTGGGRVTNLVVRLDEFAASVVVDRDTDLGLLRRVLGALC